MLSTETTGRSDHAVGTGGPALVGANWFRFRPLERIRHEQVASVSFIWAVQGSGVIRSRGRSFPIDTSVLLRLPWRHDVDYLADARSPFHLGTIHLVPVHDEGPVEGRVAHLADDPLLHSPERRGLRDETPMTIPRRSPAGRRLTDLGSYAIERFHHAARDTSILRALGVLILDADASRQSAPGSEGDPVMLEWMKTFVLDNIARPLTVAEIAAAGGCSVSTAERLFTRHTGRSTHAWARQQQLEDAARLLRSTSLSVAEVAARVGFADPLYFSRAFRAAFSVPPSRYARLQLRP